MDRFGLLTDGLRTRLAIHLAFQFVMMARRICLVALLFWDSQTPQMLLYRFMMIAILIYVGHFKPSIDPATHVLDLVNECFLLMQTNLMPVFTSFVSDPHVRFKVGWVSAALLILQVLISCAVIIKQTIKLVILRIRRCRVRRQIKLNATTSATKQADKMKYFYDLDSFDKVSRDNDDAAVQALSNPVNIPLK